jgi:phage tail sheath gpL-like
MAADLNIKWTMDKSNTQLLEELVSSDPRKALQKLENSLQGLKGGCDAATLVVNHTQVAATGTVTCASVLAADTVTVSGVLLTAVSGAPAADQFDMSGTDTATATSLALAMNSNATISGIVTATSALGVVTLTAKVKGVVGNAITLASSNGTRLAASAARLTSGSDGTTITLAIKR